MSKHQTTSYLRWRRVIDFIWPFNPWMRQSYPLWRDTFETLLLPHQGQHEKTFMEGRLGYISPWDVSPIDLPPLFLVDDEQT